MCSDFRRFKSFLRDFREESWGWRDNGEVGEFGFEYIAWVLRIFSGRWGARSSRNEVCWSVSRDNRVC